MTRVRTPVSPKLEVTEIQTRLLAENGPAVLFENVVDAENKPYGMPMLVNLFGSVTRVAMGMGQTPKTLREIGDMLAFLRQPEPPGGWREAFELLPLLRRVMTMKPKSVSAGVCQEVVWTGDDVDLHRLPIQTCWRRDAYPRHTLGISVRRPSTGPQGRTGQLQNCPSCRTGGGRNCHRRPC